ncbi:MAG TPA: hypothetical protein VFI31_07545, partial [Pirellulales bacterium]|nr:hypothetical protein [Pirellulales bacterium]
AASQASEEDLIAQHHELFSELGADLGRQLRDESLVRDWIAWRRSGAGSEGIVDLPHAGKPGD